MVLPPELFEGPYFCREERGDNFAEARGLDDDEAVARMRGVARELGVVIPVSFFERAGQAYYNSVAIIDADGAVLGVYRKSHIPDGPGYEEKFYFRPGDTGFRVWPTRFGALGVGICWDQWFPEAARAMMLLGAEVLLYPTAIGSEPHEPDLDTRDPWQRAMIGHAVSNIVPGRGGQPNRGRGRADILRLVVHRRPPRRQGGRAGPGRRGCASSHAFDLDAARAHAGLVGLLPRPSPRALRRAVHGRRQLRTLSAARSAPFAANGIAQGP